MKDIKKQTLDWLWSAIDNKENIQIISIQDDCAVATDGYRVHAINRENLPGIIDNLNFFDIFNSISNNSSSITKFKINPEFLSKALRGFSRTVDITLTDDYLIVANYDNDDIDNNEAIIMLVLPEEKEND